MSKWLKKVATVRRCLMFNEDFFLAVTFKLQDFNLKQPEVFLCCPSEVVSHAIRWEYVTAFTKFISAKQAKILESFLPKLFQQL